MTFLIKYKVIALKELIQIISYKEKLLNKPPKIWCKNTNVHAQSIPQEIDRKYLEVTFK